MLADMVLIATILFALRFFYLLGYDQGKIDAGFFKKPRKKSKKSRSIKLKSK